MCHSVACKQASVSEIIVGSSRHIFLDQLYGSVSCAAITYYCPAFAVPEHFIPGSFYYHYYTAAFTVFALSSLNFLHTYYIYLMHILYSRTSGHFITSILFLYIIFMDLYVLTFLCSIFCSRFYKHSMRCCVFKPNTNLRLKGL